MKLYQYLNLVKEKPIRWAIEHGLPITTIWRAYKGIGFPSPKTIKDIRRASNGAVKAEDWYE